MSEADAVKYPLKVRTVGDPVLAAHAKDISVIDDGVRRLSAEMLDCMYKHNGIGLAGNQVGFPYRIVVIDIAPPEDEEGNPLPANSPGERELLPKMPITLINPRITERSQVTSLYNEGCLSVPKLFAEVERPVSVTLDATLLDGTKINLECAGLLARVVQHELDHLDGVVFVQRLTEERLAKIENGIGKLAKKAGRKNFKVKLLTEEK